MKQSLRERFIFWLCDTFGHKYDINDVRVFNGSKQADCERCKLIIEVKEKNMNTSTNQQLIYLVKRDIAMLEKSLNGLRTMLSSLESDIDLSGEIENSLEEDDSLVLERNKIERYSISEDKDFYTLNQKQHIESIRTHDFYDYKVLYVYCNLFKTKDSDNSTKKPIIIMSLDYKLNDEVIEKISEIGKQVVYTHNEKSIYFYQIISTITIRPNRNGFGFRFGYDFYDLELEEYFESDIEFYNIVTDAARSIYAELNKVYVEKS